MTITEAADAAACTYNTATRDTPADTACGRTPLVSIWRERRTGAFVATLCRQHDEIAERSIAEHAAIVGERVYDRFPVADGLAAVPA